MAKIDPAALLYRHAAYCYPAQTPPPGRYVPTADCTFVRYSGRLQAPAPGGGTGAVVAAVYSYWDDVYMVTGYVLRLQCGRLQRVLAPTLDVWPTPAG